MNETRLSDRGIPAAIREELIRIINPRRPGRDPSLAQHLTLTDMEHYSQALEMLAEGDHEKALVEFGKLRENYPNVWLLDIAEASGMLFANKNIQARDILMEVENSGQQLTGTALWNLACAQIRLNDLEGGRYALDACSKTEFRNNPQVWTALKLLGLESSQTIDTGKGSDKKTSVTNVHHPLLHQLPDSVDECRKEILHRIIKPAKIPKAYRPDLGRLPQRERQNVVIILDAAYRAAPSEASRMLLPLINQYPDLYTLKVHTAAHLMLDGEFQQSRSLLYQAENMRPLDAISRYNFAFIHMHFQDYTRVAEILEGAIGSSMADTYTFWLALAISREIGNHKGSSDAAAHALALVENNQSEKVVKEVLQAAQVHAGAKVSLEKPTILAARDSLKCVEEGNIGEAIKTLESAGGPDIEQIPEIGPQVLEPRFFNTPLRRWKPEISRTFNSATRQYLDGQYSDAAAAYLNLYQTSLDLGASPVVNITAAYLKAGEPKRAREYGRQGLRRHRFGKHLVTWFLAYNLSLAYLILNERERAIQTIKQFRHYNPRNLTALLVAVSASDKDDTSSGKTLTNSLDELIQSVSEPSDNLMLSYAWALISQPKPDLENAKRILRELAQRSQRELQPPAEIKSMQQVRVAYDALTVTGDFKKAVDYMVTVVEARSRERLMAIEVSTRDLDQSVGVEFIARVFLIRALGLINERERAIRELDEAETLLNENNTLLAPGFLARDWLELANVANEIGFPQAAIRYCNMGLDIEPENKKIGELKSKFQDTSHNQIAERPIEDITELKSLIEVGNFAQASQKLEKIRKSVPTLADAFGVLINHLESDAAATDIDDICDYASIVARMELPDNSYSTVDEILTSILLKSGSPEARIPIDIDVYDEMIWPCLDDEREATCLLTFSTRHDIENLVISDLVAEREIWTGKLKSGDTQYIRWVFFREDSFSPNTPLELPLLLKVEEKDRITQVRTLVNVMVGTDEPVWPTYPTGALSPEDVYGAELYGRSALIRKITLSLGKSRSQATYFLQGPRQMGKTSVLYFVKNQCPNHILPVYINLEKEWSKHEPNNLWAYIARRVLEERPGYVGTINDVGLSERDLIRIVSETCEELKKEYVLLLLDELHILFEKSHNPGGVLASFRDFLNNRENRIALLLSDRYTMDELERRCPSEYWAQLSLLAVGPLDNRSTVQAIEYPTRGTDVSFLPETIEQIYKVTGGYPYHVQRVAQYMLDKMYSGPWLTAMPQDVDAIIPQLLEQDILFQSGLCRPDRIDNTLAEAIAALLEWVDLCNFLPSLLVELQADNIKAGWKPRPIAFLAHMNNPERVLRRLIDVGILRKDGEAFFSPLLEDWLRNMRRQARVVSGDGDGLQWQLISAGDGGSLTSRDWQNLDSELVRRAKSRGKPPLREKASRADDWDTLVREVNSENSFSVFLDSLFRLIIDERDEKDAMPQYPWLFLVYHRIRLVRNYVVHRSKTNTALSAWNEICTRAFGGERSAYWPVTSDEWRTLQTTILRNLYAGINNALEIASKPE